MEKKQSYHGTLSDVLDEVSSNVKEKILELQQEIEDKDREIEKLEKRILELEAEE